MPAKWAEVPATTDPTDLRQVITMMRKSWRLPTPSVIISVTGGAQSLNLTDKQKLVTIAAIDPAALNADHLIAVHRSTHNTSH